MCIILDANSFGKFNDKSDEDMKPVRKWVYGKYGKIVYSDTEKFRNEWKGRGEQLVRELLQNRDSRHSSSTKMGWQEALRQLRRRDKFKFVSAADVQAKADALEQTGELSSNDWHIIALAMLANVKVLVVQRIPDTPIGGRGRSRGADPALQADFKDRNLVGGKVYITKGHSRLLRKDTCP